MVCICSLLNRDYRSFSSISAIFVTGKILKLINYHEKQNSFGGSFTAIPSALQRSLLETAARNVERYGFAGIRLSTRPDAVGPEQLQLLQPYPVTTIELGVQSLQDSVLLGFLRTAFQKTLCRK